MRTFSDRARARFTERLGTAPPPPIPPPPAPEPPRAQRILQWIWKQITFKRLVLAAFGIPLGIYLLSEARRHIIVLDPIVVPKQFVDSGLTSEVMTQRVKERMEDIQITKESDSSREPISRQENQSVPDIEIPETKLSLQVLVNVLRKVLGNEPTHLAGEIISLDANGKAEIRCRELRSGELIQVCRPRELATTDADRSAESLARQLTELTDPYLVGYYLKEKKEFPAASEVAERMLYAPSDTDHMYAKAHLLRGYIASDQGDANKAIAEDLTAIQIDSEWAYPHHCLAFVLDKHNNWEEAAGEYRQVIKMNETRILDWSIRLDPKFSVAHNNLGIILSKQGKLDEAEAEYHKAIHINPRDALPHNNLGTILSKQGKLDEAEAEYHKAIGIDPKFAFAHYNLAVILGSEDKLDEAAAEYQRAIQIDPGYALAHYNLGVVLGQQDKPNEAAAEYQRAIQIDPRYALAHYNLGVILGQQDKPNEAAAEYQRAIQIDPRYALAHYNLGVVLDGQGKPNEAAAEYQRVLQIDPRYAPAHYNLGRMLIQQGKRDQAAAEFKAAHELNPTQF